jgi:hypothetical protein
MKRNLDFKPLSRSELNSESTFMVDYLFFNIFKNMVCFRKIKILFHQKLTQIYNAYVGIRRLLCDFSKSTGV